MSRTVLKRARAKVAACWRSHFWRSLWAPPQAWSARFSDCRSNERMIYATRLLLGRAGGSSWGSSQAPFRLIPVKFLGGLLAIGSGLALGREGPSVQMSASIAHLVGKLFNRDWADCRVLLAAGAGAGLATAFNAPIAGEIFVLKEPVRRFEVRIAIAALGASATAISISRVFLGDAPDVHVDALGYAGGARATAGLIQVPFAAYLRFPNSRQSRLQDCRLRWPAAAELRRAAWSPKVSGLMLDTKASAAAESTAGVFASCGWPMWSQSRWAQAPEYSNPSPASSAPSWFLVRCVAHASLLLR